jgi:hypothetical protein
MLNERLAAMGRGEQSPAQAKKIRYEHMRTILLNRYREENNIARQTRNSP